MPQTKSAKKALRQSLKKRQYNLYYLNKIREIRKEIRNILAKKSKGDIKKAESQYYKFVDKAVKKNIFHRHKGARLKSQISALIKTGVVKPVAKKKTKKK